MGLTTFAIRAMVMLAGSLNEAVFQLARAVHGDEEYYDDEETNDLDVAGDSSDITISMEEIDLGDITLRCPECLEGAHCIAVGLGVADDTDELAETDEFMTIGVVAFPCGEVFHSPCLAERVGKILNAWESNSIEPSMLLNLTGCEEHGE